MKIPYLQVSAYGRIEYYRLSSKKDGLEVLDKANEEYARVGGGTIRVGDTLVNLSNCSTVTVIEREE